MACQRLGYNRTPNPAACRQLLMAGNGGHRAFIYAEREHVEGSVLDFEILETLQRANLQMEKQDAYNA
jgi:hypothetical protein